jgi:hypothetical protein
LGGLQRLALLAHLTAIHFSVSCDNLRTKIEFFWSENETNENEIHVLPSFQLQLSHANQHLVDFS